MIRYTHPSRQIRLILYLQSVKMTHYPYEFMSKKCFFGQGTHQYTIQENWWTLPDKWEFGWIPAVAVFRSLHWTENSCKNGLTYYIQIRSS